MKSSTINRRKFLQWSGITGTGLLLGLSKTGLAETVSKFGNIGETFSIYAVYQY